MYYNVCPHCGAYLDPGERCDCGENGDKKEPPPVVATPGAEKKNALFLFYQYREAKSSVSYAAGHPAG